jgi:hypothetical protein
LLNRLAREWEPEFDTLCTLLANSTVVHLDETGWSINSVWAFLSEQVRMILFGVHKDGATLATLLPKDLFGGVLVSDDAAVYRGFTLAQKCWAHLIRKAIRGARRRTVLTSVLESLRLSLSDFTLSHVLQEVTTWLVTGRSRFGQLLESQNLPPPECSPLDALLPATGGP